MQSFPIYTIESAPAQSKPALQSLNAAFGMIPNIAGAMATSPVLINSLVGLFQRVHGGSFTEAQIQTLLLTNAVTNASAWAVAFHTALALKEGLDPADVNAIREGRAPGDRQHAALSTLAKTLIEKRGRLDDQDVDQFTGAGFRKDLVLEVIAVVAASTSRTTPAALQSRQWRLRFGPICGISDVSFYGRTRTHCRHARLRWVIRWT
jgi:alkylhydroperoxidase family enzyme